MNAYLRRMPRFHKYGAEAQVVDGHKFPSKREARRYGELKMLVQAGEISKLELQPKYELGTDDAPILLRSERYPNGRRAAYFADFRYYRNHAGITVVEDVKGMDTPLSRLKRAIVHAQYGIEIVLV